MIEQGNNDPIGKALGIPEFKNEASVDKLIAKAHDNSARNDFEAARANLYEVIQTNQEAMDKLLQIAEQSQHPRAFEVLGKLMDTHVQANKELLELQSKIREIDAAESSTSEGSQTINNNLFVGSTAELQKMIKEMKDGS
jgi:predicted transcriptional regulator